MPRSRNSCECVHTSLVERVSIRVRLGDDTLVVSSLYEGFVVLDSCYGQKEIDGFGNFGGTKIVSASTGTNSEDNNTYMAMHGHDMYTIDVDELLPVEVIDFLSELEVFVNSLINTYPSPESETGDMMLNFMEIPLMDDEEESYEQSDEEGTEMEW